MPNGYTGKILHVDLTSGTLTTEEPDESFYRTYMGGSAMGMHYVLKDCPAGADPLGDCLLYTSPSPRDVEESRMPSSA